MRAYFVAALLCAGSANAFVPRALTTESKATSTTARAFGVDPSFFQDLHQHVDAATSFVSSFNLADAVDSVNAGSAAVVDAVTTIPAAETVSAVSAAVAPAAPAVDAAAEVAQTGNQNGWFGFLTYPIEGLLQIIHSVFSSVGMDSNAWGVAIVTMTVLIKVVTLPLTKTQLESTNKMQALQPKLKEMQAKYASNPEVMNQKIAEMYQANEVNPLAGCLPSLVQIPIFIGLYRAVLNLAQEDKLNEPFLWLPSLEGPTYGADPTHGSDWIMQGWVDGVPSLGWEATAAFLAMPVLLVVSQFASMQLMQPKDSEQANNIVLKLLPLMIGWFSLNVPAALCVYWLTNNFITTALTLFIKNSMGPIEMVTPGADGAAATPASTIFAPPREKPTGFAAPATTVVTDVKPITSVPDVKPITPEPVVDAEIVDVPEVAEVSEVAEVAETGMDASKKRSKKKGKKRKK